MIELTTIKNGLYDFFATICNNVVKLTLSADLINGNEITGKINGTAINKVTFTTSHTNTMTLLAQSIALNSGVVSTTVSGVREITIVFNRISNILYSWIVAKGTSQATISFTHSTNINIQWERNNLNKAASPRIGLDLLTFDAFGSPVTVNIDENGIATFGQEATLILRTIITGTIASSICSLLKAGLFINDADETLRNNTGLSILNTTAPNDISGFNDQFVEERWTIDITFSLAYSDMMEVGIIEHISIEGDLIYEDASKRIIPVFTIDKE